MPSSPLRFTGFLLLLCLNLFAFAQNPAVLEQRAARAFHTAEADPLSLHAFLERMPKGGDLHMHLSGAVYAETFIQDAIADDLCVDTTALSLARNIGSTRSIPPQPVCDKGQVPASNVLKDQKLYDELVDSFSMRGFVPTPGVTGHDQFFATFGRFGNLKDHTGEWLDEVATRAAAQNEQYLEIMFTPSFSAAASLGYKFGWPASSPIPLPADATGDPSGATRPELAHLRDRLLADPAFRQNVEADRKEIADALAARSQLEHCTLPSAASGCHVEIRFLGQVLRAFPPEQVFAQTLLYFELAAADPNVVGINFVQPEDSYMSMSEYHRQMLMLDFLHPLYPGVHISLHAGELAPGMVPPAGLRFHIREAVELGHAERIGHGVDIMQETDPYSLLSEMAGRHIMVEINLTSNDVILGIKPPNHPFPIYRAFHVPVALSTDDEGVSRIDLTHEYTRAVEEYHLSYKELKDIARTSIEHSFLPGASLWQEPDVFTRPVAACTGQVSGAAPPDARCADLLKSSQKAAAQWELERRFHLFEASLSK